MQPRTKIQREVQALSDLYYPRTSNQILSWGECECLPYIALRNKSRIACLECGYIWKRDTNRKKCVCPSCKSKLLIEDTRDRVRRQEDYFLVLDTCCGYQVCRYYKVKGTYKVGYSAYKEVSEVCQHWITEDGKVVIYALLHKVNWTQDYWTGEFSIRSNTDRYRYWKNNLYNLNPCNYYPKSEILPSLRKKGINGYFGGVSPLDTILNVLEDNRAESLLKMKQYGLLSMYISKSGAINRFWRSICICHRNRYTIKDASMWLDYVDALDFLEKDIRNAHYICPKNLKEEHDKYIKKRSKKMARIEHERKLREAIENEDVYRLEKGCFFGLVFRKGDLSVSALNSVQEFVEEGEKLKHCVYTSSYYKKKSSLIFSVKEAEVSIATLELSLETGEILQCRGRFNSRPDRHDEIVMIVQKHFDEIKSRMAS